MALELDPRGGAVIDAGGRDGMGARDKASCVVGEVRYRGAVEVETALVSGRLG
jgi:hypothetical protein